MTDRRRTVLLTGATGYIAGQLLPALRERYDRRHVDVRYTDRDGNQTSFSFSGYHRRAAPAATFTFAPPAGVQVIRAD